MHFAIFFVCLLTKKTATHASFLKWLLSYFLCNGYFMQKPFFVTTVQFKYFFSLIILASVLFWKTRIPIEWILFQSDLRYSLVSWPWAKQLPPTWVTPNSALLQLLPTATPQLLQQSLMSTRKSTLDQQLPKPKSTMESSDQELSRFVVVVVKKTFKIFIQ